MTNLLTTLGSWNWLVVGAVLMALETLAPGIFLIWLGLAAVLVGLLSLLIDWSWQVQVLAFAVFALAAVPLWRHFARRHGSMTDQPFLNRRAEALIGRELTLTKPIVGGIGTMSVDDTIWRVAGPDAPSGSRVRIVQADGGSLRVEVV